MKQTTFRYDVSGLARKDPFDISLIPELKDENRPSYYTGIATFFLGHRIMRTPEVFSQSIKSLNYFSLTRYLSKKRDILCSIYAGFNDGERIKRGNIEITTANEAISDEVISVLGLMQKIENSELARISEPRENAQPAIAIATKPIEFQYFTGQKFPYFIFDFQNKDHFRIVKELR